MKLKFLIILIFVHGFVFNVLALNNAKKLKIAIISLYDEAYKKVGQHSDENKKKYANKHGYDVFIYHEILDQTRPPAWSKILAIQRHLAHYDWIYWSDADSLVMKTDTKLEDFIDDKVDMIISKGCYEGNLNMGSFLLKNSTWSHALLKKIYDQTFFIHDPLWEQAAFQYILQQDPKQLTHVKVLPQRKLNANYGYGDTAYWYQPGDFIVHFYGPCNKAVLMKSWSEKIVY